MKASSFFVFASSFVLVAAAVVACSSPSGSNGACTAYTVPASTDLTTPTISFTNDVFPIFEMSCGLSSSCHGSQTSTTQVFLGSASAGVSASMVRAGIVNMPSKDLPSMSFVKPGDAEQSFLMHKMDGDQCLFDSQCTGGTCQTSMPQDLPLLDVPTRDIVRRWIAQGAADN